MDKDDVVCVNRHINYSAIKQNEIVPLAAAWIDQEIIILGQREKDKYITY